MKWSITLVCRYLVLEFFVGLKMRCSGYLVSMLLLARFNIC